MDREAVDVTAAAVSQVIDPVIDELYRKIEDDRASYERVVGEIEARVKNLTADVGHVPEQVAREVGSCIEAIKEAARAGAASVPVTIADFPTVLAHTKDCPTCKASLDGYVDKQYEAREALERTADPAAVAADIPPTEATAVVADADPVASPLTPPSDSDPRDSKPESSPVRFKLTKWHDVWLRPEVDYKEIPEEFGEPNEGDETENPAEAEAWRAALHEVEEILSE